MSRSFRTADAFEDKRERFAQRKAAREDRRRQFESLGFDDPDAVAALPIHGERRREQARRALRW